MHQEENCVGKGGVHEQEGASEAIVMLESKEKVSDESDLECSTLRCRNMDTQERGREKTGGVRDVGVEMNEEGEED